MNYKDNWNETWWWGPVKKTKGEGQYVRLQPNHSVAGISAMTTTPKPTTFTRNDYKIVSGTI